jgi:ABC-2 type transport system permease protein
LALTTTALRQSLSERAAVLGRMAFYAVILLIFSRLWTVVSESGALPGRSTADLLWYLAITEWVMLSLPPIHLEIEHEIRTGDIAYRLARPISYVGAKLAESAGDVGLRLVTLGAAGIALAWGLSGEFPGDSRGLVFVVPLGLLAAAVGVMFNMSIGLAAFWLQDCSPVHWIWQKLAFILGGLMLPLDIYPDWLRAIALWSPFSALMYGPGRMAFGWDPTYAAIVAGKLILWAALAALLLRGTYRRALIVLDVNGG